MKIVCKTSQGSTTTWWRWRIIDGKKCWYPGKAVIDNSQLTWEPPEVLVKRFYMTLTTLFLAQATNTPLTLGRVPRVES